jgi:hypothetical protein
MARVGAIATSMAQSASCHERRILLPSRSTRDDQVRRAIVVLALGAAASASRLRHRADTEAISRDLPARGFRQPPWPGPPPRARAPRRVVRGVSPSRRGSSTARPPQRLRPRRNRNAARRGSREIEASVADYRLVIATAPPSSRDSASRRDAGSPPSGARPSDRGRGSRPGSHRALHHLRTIHRFGMLPGPHGPLGARRRQSAGRPAHGERVVVDPGRRPRP